jgi:subtilisin family serine protease
VTQIRAPEVWHTLGISGTGVVVVAVMDTGADGQHPPCWTITGGNLGHGFVNHSGSWYDAVNEGIYPYDDHGHGSHVTGSAVGRRNIGVAPGAQWISVKILAGDGYGLRSLDSYRIPMAIGAWRRPRPGAGRGKCFVGKQPERTQRCSRRTFE